MQQTVNNKFCLKDKKDLNLFGKPEKYDYSKFTNLQDFDWDNELADKFSPIAQKLNLSQDSIDMLLELALEMSNKQKAFYDKEENMRYIDNIEKYNKLFYQDKELPNVNSIRIREYMEVANEAYSEFTSPKLKEILEKTGLNYHPELIKMFHKIGELSKEDNLSHYGKPKTEELTPAQILYGTSNK